MSVDGKVQAVQPNAAFDWFNAPLGVGLLVGGMATVGVGVQGVIDTLVGPTGQRLVSISTIIDLPAALCLLGAVVLLVLHRRRQIRVLARAIAAGAGLLLFGLKVVGLVGVIELGMPRHGRSAILKASEAASESVGYLTALALAAVFLVLAFTRSGDAA